MGLAWYTMAETGELEPGLTQGFSPSCVLSCGWMPKSFCFEACFSLLFLLFVARLASPGLTLADGIAKLPCAISLSFPGRR